MKRLIRIVAISVLALGVFDGRDQRVIAQGSTQEPLSGQPGRSRGGATNKLYIVRMAELPVALYDGGLQGYPATKPARGSKFDPDSTTVSSYAGYLDRRHSEVVARVGGRKVYDFKYAFNGFAAEFSEAQAEIARTQAGVLSVTKDELRDADTSSTPTFLGLDAPGGLWDRLGGVDDAGEDIVIGVIDSGIWPESESFSDRTDPKKPGKKGKKTYRHLPGWHGKCKPGEAFPASKCNQKLIGARRFNEAWGGDAGVKALRPWEYASPRDYNGHGTHTAATAGGNSDVDLTGPAAIFGSASGMAPRARISVYKALWSTQDGSQASGFNSDLVAAIDQAVADGVDVINYSISGTLTNFLDPAEISFLFAADAGVFVAASAGNSGPANFTVAHPSPWITTVAAGTHNRTGNGSVRLGNNVTYSGPSLATPVGPAPLIDSINAGLPGANANALSLCFTAADNGGTAVLDPAKVAGKIVVCDRGVNARVSKSLAVRDAGGVGMILVNVTPNSQNADFHYVPTVHLGDTDRAAIKTYAAGAGATAQINQSTIVYNVPAPFTALFSSRGPLLASPDLLKPDVIAPGQDIIAAVAPTPANGGLSFNLYSGTSMSSPHVAGLAALLKQAHPNWSPMAIKSALMTSAGDVLDGPNTSAGVIFRQGAGHVSPNDAVSPGLVYDSSALDWLAFLCGTTNGVTPATCSALSAAGYSLDPSDLNTPSIAVGALAGTQTVTRTVTNVGSGSATYAASIAGMVGFNVTVTPSSLTLAQGESRSFDVTITRTTAAINAYAGGQLTWTDGNHNVRSPIVALPVALSAPAQISGTGGPLNYNVAFGYTGPFTAQAQGLIPATLTPGSVADDPGDSFSPTGPGVVAIPVVVPSGTTYARFSLFDANVTPPSDLDLYVYNSSGTQVGGSGSGTSAEEVNLVNPPAGNYTVYVHGFAVTGTANFTLFSWALGSTAAGNMTVNAPANATLGTSGTINLTFSGLAPATKYLGSVAYGGSAGLPNPTIVRIDTP
jgi:subtilisin family serine protease